jgi:hypothetical protein
MFENNLVINVLTRYTTIFISKDEIRIHENRKYIHNLFIVVVAHEQFRVNKRLKETPRKYSRKGKHPEKNTADELPFQHIYAFRVEMYLFTLTNK